MTTRYRWHYAGATDARPRVSGVALIKVRTPQHAAQRLGTTLSVRAVRPAVAPGGKTVVRGILRSGRVELRGRKLVLLSRTSAQKSWQFRNVKRTARDGHVSFTVRPRTRTAYRLAFAGTNTFRPAKSAVVHVGIRKGAPSSLSIRGRDVPKGFAVSGQLRAAGARRPQRGRDPADPRHGDRDVGRHGHAAHRPQRRRPVRAPQRPGRRATVWCTPGSRFASSTSATLTD